jgi:hypothetical protein
MDRAGRTPLGPVPYPRTDDIYCLAVARQFLGDQPSEWARLQGEISGWTELKERMRIYYEVPNKNKNSRESLYRPGQIGSVKEVYTLFQIADTADLFYV